MGLQSSPYYGAVAVWWMERNVPYILFLDSRSTNSLYADVVMSKCPGGTSNTSPQEAVYRELREETGLAIRRNAKLIPIHHTSNGLHTKQGFLIHRRECVGRLRKSWKREQRSLLGPPYRIKLDHAIAKVHTSQRNQFHPIFLRKVRKEIASQLEVRKRSESVQVKKDLKSAAA